MDADASVDRKTFFLGIFVAVAVLLIGYYALNRFMKNDAPPTESARAMAAQPQAPEVLEKSPFVKDVHSDSEALSVMNASGKPKVVLVHAPWCGHCRNMMGSFVQAASMEPSVEWLRVDGNNAPSLVKRSDLRGFPTVYGIAADGTVTQHSGSRDASSLIAFARTVGGADVPPTLPIIEEVAKGIEEELDE